MSMLPVHYDNLREMPMPQEEKKTGLECVYGDHKGEVMHKGTIYCRKCYDDRNMMGTLIN